MSHTAALAAKLFGIIFCFANAIQFVLFDSGWYVLLTRGSSFFLGLWFPNIFNNGQVALVGIITLLPLAFWRVFFRLWQNRRWWKLFMLFVIHFNLFIYIGTGSCRWRIDGILSRWRGRRDWGRGCWSGDWWWWKGYGLGLFIRSYGIVYRRLSDLKSN